MFFKFDGSGGEVLGYGGGGLGVLRAPGDIELVGGAGAGEVDGAESEFSRERNEVHGGVSFLRVDFLTAACVS